VARNVSVHATAKLKAPAFLGENSRIGPLVKVGPGASIGRDCLIERETFVSDSVVFGGSYVGQHLKLRGVVVDRSRLINPRWDVEIEGVDDLLLGSVFNAPWNIGLQRACARIAAAVGLLAAFPFLFVMLVCSAVGLMPALRREFMVRTPAVSEVLKRIAGAFSRCGVLARSGFPRIASTGSAIFSSASFPPWPRLPQATWGLQAAGRAPGKKPCDRRIRSVAHSFVRVPDIYNLACFRTGRCRAAS
jgi:hypothetical protein